LSFFFSSRRRHTRSDRDWSSDVCSSDLEGNLKVVLTPYQDRFSIVPIPARTLEVFDLDADPLERHDLSAHLTKPVAEMVDVLWRRARGVLSGPTRDDEAGPPLPEELLQQLRSLGYLH